MLTRIKCLFSTTPVELAMIMDRLYGGVCYAGIDTDPELKYPKGAGRVAFSNQQSYIAAISARFVQLQHNDIDKRVSEFTLFFFCHHSNDCDQTRLVFIQNTEPLQGVAPHCTHLFLWTIVAYREIPLKGVTSP
uniref:Uncharacterized protein n=1 Tax=Hippocampus comes TaxID=109280 RepID=A0A3Q2YS68_HIPCM